MGQLKWEIFNFGHLSRLGLKAKDSMSVRLQGADRYALVSPDNEVVLVLFLVPLGKRSVNIFLLPGATIQKYRKSVMHMLAINVENYMTIKNLLRLQATTEIEPKLIRFMKRLGFHQEAVLEKFDDGNDHILWAYLRGGG